MYTNYLNRNDFPRGIRNNNPANIRLTNITWGGEVPHSQNKDWSGNPYNVVREFEQYVELRYGIRAMMRNIYTNYTRGKITVTDLISHFSPSFENNTESYINTVVKMIGSNLIGELTQEKMIALCKAIVLVENGLKYSKYITDKDYNDAIAILGIQLKKKVA